MLSLCPLQAVSFECLDLEHLFLVCRYLFGIYWSSWYITASSQSQGYWSKKECLCILIAVACHQLRGNFVSDAAQLLFFSVVEFPHQVAAHAASGGGAVGHIPWRRHSTLLLLSHLSAAELRAVYSVPAASNADDLKLFARYLLHASLFEITLCAVSIMFMTDFISIPDSAFSLPGQFTPWSKSSNRTLASSLLGTFAPWNFCYLGQLLPGANWLGNFHSQKLSFPVSPCD